MFNKKQKAEALNLRFAMEKTISLDAFVAELGWPSRTCLAGWILADPRHNPDKATYRSKSMPTKLDTDRRIVGGTPGLVHRAQYSHIAHPAFHIARYLHVTQPTSLFAAALAYCRGTCTSHTRPFTSHAVPACRTQYSHIAHGTRTSHGRPLTSTQAQRPTHASCHANRND